MNATNSSSKSLEEEIAILKAAVSRAEADAEKMQVQLIDALTQCSAMEASTSWRLTRPLRLLGGKLSPKLKRNLHRGAKAVWWTITLQLPARIRAWRASSRSIHFSLDKVPGSSGGSSTLLKGISKPVALIVDYQWPQPTRDGGSIDAVNLVAALVEFGYCVIFTAEGNYSGGAVEKRELEAMGAICLAPETSESVESFLEESGAQLSVVVLTRIYSGGRLFELVREQCPDAKIIFNTVDLHFVREERHAELVNEPAARRNAARTRARELYLVRKADATIVVSAAERALLHELVPGSKIIDLPLGRSGIASPAGFEGRRNIGFIGGFAHTPNTDAVRYFLEEIWPFILTAVPDCRFSIVGADMPSDVIGPSVRNVSYEGYLADIGPWFNGLRLSVAPLRFGAGMKGKVVSSLAAGVPCVGTSVAVEGMPISPGVHMLVDDNPEEFAKKVVEIYTNEKLWAQLSMAGHEYAATQNSVSMFRRRLHAGLIELGMPALTPV